MRDGRAPVAAGQADRAAARGDELDPPPASTSRRGRRATAEPQPPLGLTRARARSRVRRPPGDSRDACRACSSRASIRPAPARLRAPPRPRDPGDQPPAGRHRRRVPAHRRRGATPGDVARDATLRSSDRPARAASRSSSTEPPRARSMKARILVIDDEAGDPRLDADDPRVRRLRGARGVERARRASRMAERESPDLVFLDIKMPGMDGLEVLQRLRGDERGAAGRDDLGARHRQHRARGDQGSARSTSSRSRSSKRRVLDARSANALEPDAAADENRTLQPRRRSPPPDGRRERRRSGRSGMRSSARRRPTRRC